MIDGGGGRMRTLLRRDVIITITWRLFLIGLGFAIGRIIAGG
jgi:hypothetical protein